MVGSLEGKVGLVTGGSTGIGRAVALAFAREGAKVVVADVAVDEGKETVLIIEETSAGIFVKTDVSQASEVEATVQTVIETYGQLDCAFNNAGIRGTLGLVHSYPPDVWEQVINVNLKGVWLCLRYEIPPMLKQGGGVIVNMASVSGLVASPRSGAYTVSKFGVIGLTKQAAVDYAQAGIRVNAVCPGFIETPFHTDGVREDPDFYQKLAEISLIKRVGTPKDVAAAVVWLCSDAASYVTGHSLVVDGGLLTRSFSRDEWFSPVT